MLSWKLGGRDLEDIQLRAVVIVESHTVENPTKEVDGVIERIVEEIIRMAGKMRYTLEEMINVNCGNQLIVNK